RWQDFRATPFEMGLGGLVNLDAGHEFVGRVALEALSKTTPARQRIGLIIDKAPALPVHPAPLLRDGEKVGFISEMVFSKRVGSTIGIGLVSIDLALSDTLLTLQTDGATYEARVANLPFL
ncbi:MAG: glycine cleavage system protein T, partial [Litoreibacter sp.]|nr:glycine cleavage system protein T [Litoreibacter sp.]